MIDIRQPNISAATEKEQLIQMRSYLYQLAQQLQWAFGTISASSGGNTVLETRKTGGGSGAETSFAAANFAELKSLIIKSAEIVDAYYEEINKKLVGVYVAQSDFGIYAEQTSNEITANNTGISQLYENTRIIQLSVDSLDADAVQKSKDIQALDDTAKEMKNTVGALETNIQNTDRALDSLSSDVSAMEGTVNSLNTAVIETSAYIKTGLLYEKENGTPAYGLEIGQTNSVNGENVFSKFARFTADRLSFYDRNDTEVAYISDYKLYITNAEITGSLALAGKFKIYYNNGLAFQWIGGNN